MKTCIRLDDITHNMDWDRFFRVSRILTEADLKPLIGVVPDVKDEKLDCLSMSDSWPEEVRTRIPEGDDAFAEYIRDLRHKGWIIAMHGYDHVYRTGAGGLFPLNLRSEFAGCDYEDQKKRLAAGMERMRDMGLDTDIFMAPAHSYDANTLRALYDTGVRNITDGFGLRPYRRTVPGGKMGEYLTFYPISRSRSEAISDKPGYTTLVLHVNTMKDTDIMKFEELIKNHRDHFMDYGDYMKVNATDRGGVSLMYEYMQATAKRVLVKLRAAGSRG